MATIIKGLPFKIGAWKPTHEELIEETTWITMQKMRWIATPELYKALKRQVREAIGPRPCRPKS